MARLSNRQLTRICAESLVTVLGDELALAREVQTAGHHLWRTHDEVLRLARREPERGEACRELLPGYFLLAGEVLRLWEPLAAASSQGEALERCRNAWERLRTTGEQLREGEAGRARRRLQRFRDDLPRLRRVAYRVTPESRVCDALLGHRDAWAVFERHGLRCLGCWVATRETIRDAAICHPFDLEALLRDLQALVEG
jgi:hybrid cluster-associated redox disulfide protein